MTSADGDTSLRRPDVPHSTDIGSPLDVCSDPVVRMTGITRRFPGQVDVLALDGVDVQIERGEHVAIMGPSGSGKSTLLNIMGLLDRPSQGEYVLNDDDAESIREGRRTALRGAEIGFVFQDFYLMNARTAEENVALGLVYAGYRARTRRMVARRMLQAVGLGHRIDALPATMSGGERQRVAIARALVNHPSLLLCDEPTGNLDSHTSAQIMDLLAGLHSEGVSVVTITHDPTVAEGAGRTIQILDGKIVDEGTTATRPSSHAVSEPAVSTPVLPSVDETPHRRRVWAAVLGEALAGLTARVSRTVLTMVGTVIGVGAIVAILGLTATAAGQIDTSFNLLQATQVSVNDAGALSPGGFVNSFPDDAVQRVSRLNGVEAAGVLSPAPNASNIVATAATLQTSTTSLPVYGATAGLFDAIQATWSQGSVFTDFEQDHQVPVVVVGSSAAQRMGVSRTGTVVFIDGFPYEVVGIFDSVSTRSELVTSLIMPLTTLRERYGDPTDFQRASMQIRTRLGAAGQVASEVPHALRPDATNLLAVIPPPDPPKMQSVISQSMSTLFVVLAGVTLLIGIAAIANTTLVAVMERTGEIGLRRAIGASGRHIMVQFLVETVIGGLIAGLIGASAGVICVLATAVSLTWTAIVDPWVIGLGPLIGAAAGLIAGIFPAWKAGRISPITALRR
ncbi:MAG: ATP-binding cassette domain-containing protein [Propionibacteriaceae bacterium]|nr:ATP-binding cassette domain-containing protein [Propionibacteriaceae bacterium]